jgi:hypothetical protein
MIGEFQPAFFSDSSLVRKIRHGVGLKGSGPADREMAAPTFFYFISFIEKIHSCLDKERMKATKKNFFKRKK